MTLRCFVFIWLFLGLVKYTKLWRNLTEKSGYIYILIRNTTESNDIITYVSTYNPKNPEMFTEIKNSMPVLMNDPKMRAV